MVQQRVVIVILTKVAILAGCAADRQAPFHVYQSPLLAQAENPRPAERSFDPAQPGDWRVDSETVIARSEDSTTKARREDRKEMRKKDRKLPALAVGMGGREAESAGGSAVEGDYAPALAAAYVHRTFVVNGVDLPQAARTSVPALWDACKKAGKQHQDRPLPGDAAFFHNVVDANQDGRNNDWYTHVGIVESVDEAGTARILSWRGGRVVEARLNAKAPEDTAVNSQIREPSPDDAPYTQYHAGQLFAGWCTVLDGKRDVILMDSWAPDAE